MPKKKQPSISLAEAARRLGTSPQQVNHLLAHGLLGKIKISGVEYSIRRKEPE